MIYQGVEGVHLNVEASQVGLEWYIEAIGFESRGAFDGLWHPSFCSIWGFDFNLGISVTFNGV
jgi:hypothetical protein